MSFGGQTVTWRPRPDAAALFRLQRMETVTTGGPPSRLPFRAWWPIAAGALVGIALRLAFWGKAGNPWSPMMASFIFLAPVLVGAATVYVAERQSRRTWWYYIWSSFAANMLFVLGTMMIMIEGLICAVVIVPLFALIGITGGLIMGAVCRLTSWPRHALYSLAVLPLVLGGLEGKIAAPTRLGAVERAVIVHAPPERVWQQIMDARDIRPEEVERAWIYRIGVPMPLSGIEEATPDGPVRKIRMGKNVHFDQVPGERRENRFVYWTYRFYPDSFPPHALDDHVVIGGHYFDLKDTSYRLLPTYEGTQLIVRMSYRVTTQFNWYAEPLARLLLGNFEEAVLEFYRQRSERTKD